MLISADMASPLRAALERDEPAAIDHCSLSPLFRGERAGVRGSLGIGTRGESPSPEIRDPRISTSPRERGEVTQMREKVRNASLRRGRPAPPRTISGGFSP